MGLVLHVKIESKVKVDVINRSNRALKLQLLKLKLLCGCLGPADFPPVTQQKQTELKIRSYTVLQIT